jgi:hypothetical protein
VTQEPLGAPTIGGGECLAQRWWWRGSKKSNKPSKPHGIYENGTKKDGLPHIDLKNAKNAFFYVKST